MEIKSFIFAKTPQIVFRNGAFKELHKVVGDSKKILFITGGYSRRYPAEWNELINNLGEKGISAVEASFSGEPTVSVIDSIVSNYRNSGIDQVVAIGGGSIMDAGKAVSAMLTKNESVMNYLEGFQNMKSHDGAKVPFVAIPTTSGTGSEATKNAVISEVGENGFKRSLRHDNFVPDVALIDPSLILSCPREVTAASGLDAFTQLLEVYVSTEASPLTDAIAWSGLEHFSSSFIPACTDQSGNISVRANMAYASLMSGIGLASAGLGVVHGMAGVIGGFFNIPHGVFCGTMVGAAVKKTISKLRESGDSFYMKKYAKVGALLTHKDPDNVEECCNALVMELEKWIGMLNIPSLSRFNISKSDLDRIVAQSSNKNNPVPLDKGEMKEILLSRL